MNQYDRQNVLESLQAVTDEAELVALIQTGCGKYSAPEFDVDVLHKWSTSVNRRDLYHSFSLKKRKGGERQVLAPRHELKRVQRVISQALVAGYWRPSPVHGYIRGRSHVSNAKYHVGKTWILRLDLRDFFPSIHLGRIYGLLRSSPYYLPEKVARSIALLCTYPLKRNVTVLPQGAPTSPIVSNLVCRKLDRELSSIAKLYRCTYTRYADDITFSTTNSKFPTDLAELAGGQCSIGAAIRDVVSKNGFEIHPEKSSLRHRTARQMVTGIVVNAKPNLPREYTRNLRAAIHNWKTLGLEGAAYDFRKKYDLKNRSPHAQDVDFRNVLRSKLHYVASIRGWGNPVVWRLAHELSLVDETFIFDVLTRLRGLPPITVFTEGISDRTHIRTALQALQSNGKHIGLELKLDIAPGIKGYQQLLQMLRKHSLLNHDSPQIFLFDRDVERILAEVTLEGAPRQWAENVYSMALPHPAFRSVDEPICIEHCYRDVDLKLSDNKGRRLYFQSEFDASGKHFDGTCFCKDGLPGALIIDNNVIDSNDGTSVAMSKAKFAHLVSESQVPFDKVDFSGFEPLFEAITRLAIGNTRDNPPWLQKILTSASA